MKKIILIGLLVTLVQVAIAQTRTPRANARQGAQRSRIQEGKASGEINKQESVALNAEQRHIRRSERRAKADGQVTIRERKRLERKQDRASRNIRRAKHNPSVGN